ncbi:hypothetical protein MRX96_054166 [Rhipicephalus microplus]
MLKKENAELKEALRTLRAEFELFRNSREPREVATPIPIQAGGSNKRKAVSPPAIAESVAMQSDESPAQVPEENVLASLTAIEESLKQSACQNGWCCVTVPAKSPRHCGRVPVFVTHHGCSAQTTPPLQGKLRRPLRIHGTVVPPGGCSGLRSRSTERARGSSTSQRRSTSRPGHVSLEPTRSRSHTPTASNTKKPTLVWADKARGRRESSRGDELNRGSPHASELDEMRRANEQLRKK